MFTLDHVPPNVEFMPWLTVHPGSTTPAYTYREAPTITGTVTEFYLNDIALPGGTADSVTGDITWNPPQIKWS
jgi:hypothetical protein